MSGVIEEIRMEVRKRAAIRMLERGKVPYEEIAEYTCIPVEEIEKMADEFQKEKSAIKTEDKN